MKSKKLSIILPLTAMISTGVMAPGISFAATNDNAKIIKNGQVVQLDTAQNTPDYYPQPNNDPYVEPPQSILVQTKYSDAKSTDFIKITTAHIAGAEIYMGIQNNHMVSSSGSVHESPLPDNVIEGTKIKEETIWERVYNRLEPRTVQNTWSLSETHGLANTNSREFGFSLGFDFIPVKDFLKFSGAINAKFGTSVTVTDQKTETKSDMFPAKPASYPYNDYRVAVYQKTLKYTIIPGQKLKDVFPNLPDEINESVYQDDELRPIVTPDNPKNDSGNPGNPGGSEWGPDIVPDDSGNNVPLG